MKSVQIKDSFGIENLKVIEKDIPEPGEHELLLEMKAVSLNYRDLLMVKGLYNPKQPLPLVPASDGVGKVVSVGKNVSRVKTNDRVCPIFCQSWLQGAPDKDKIRSTTGGPIPGTLTEYLCMNEQSVVKVPDHLTDAQAAWLPCAGVTAWSSLVTFGRIDPERKMLGQTVLVQGTGGVSIFALQFAKLHGAKVIATSSSDEKLNKLEHLGAYHLINYKKDPNWGKTVLNITKSQGVDHIIEVGGADTLAQSIQAIKIGGHISLIGVLSGVESKLNLLPLIMKHVSTQGILVGSRQSFESMNKAIELHKLQPVLDPKTFKLEDTQQALNYLASGKHFGKVIIEIAE